MKELDLKQEMPTGKFILMIKSEQCGACQAAKPMYEKLEQEFSQFNFYTLEFTKEALPFYKELIPKEIVRRKKKVNGVEKIVVSKEVPLSFPNFLVFNSNTKEETGKYGFLGNVVGKNKEGLRHVLDALTEK